MNFDEYCATVCENYNVIIHFDRLCNGEKIQVFMSCIQYLDRFFNVNLNV